MTKQSNNNNKKENPKRYFGYLIHAQLLVFLQAAHDAQLTGSLYLIFQVRGMPSKKKSFQFPHVTTSYLLAAWRWGLQ